MILIGLGANLPHPLHGPPRATLAAALEAIGAGDVVIKRRSAWYESAPVPPSDQPLFVNAVAELASPLDPSRLLAHLHGVEVAFGRVRGAPNAPRVVDLDLLDHDGRVSRPGDGLVLPHPRPARMSHVTQERCTGASWFGRAQMRHMHFTHRARLGSSRNQRMRSSLAFLDAPFPRLIIARVSMAASSSMDQISSGCGR